jgi:hypothetical protein
MSKVLSTFMVAVAALSFSSSLLAAGPETIDLPASIGKVAFTHKLHQDRLKDCTKCHATPAGGKIAGFGKDLAHKSCKGCHTETSKGPTACKDCHKK